MLRVRTMIGVSVFLAGCDPSPSKAPAPTVVSQPAADSPVAVASGKHADGKRCLPLVSGCGCAYVCAETFRVHPDGTHDVFHDFQDSRLDTVRVETWCFDEQGRGVPAGVERKGPGCREVFFDQTPCGGECIPTAQWLSCAWRGGRCRAE